MAVSRFPPELECLVHLSICQHVSHSLRLWVRLVSTPCQAVCHNNLQVTPPWQYYVILSIYGHTTSHQLAPTRTTQHN